MKPGSTSAALVGLVDVLATAAEVVGRPLAGEDRLDTISFLPVLLGRSESGNRDTLLQTRGNTVAVRHGPWRLIPGLGSFGFSKPRHQKPEPGGPRGQLYNLDEDLGERNNLWLEKPDVVDRDEVRTSGRVRLVRSGDGSPLSKGPRRPPALDTHPIDCQSGGSLRASRLPRRSRRRPVRPAPPPRSSDKPTPGGLASHRQRQTPTTPRGPLP